MRIGWCGYSLLSSLASHVKMALLSSFPCAVVDCGRYDAIEISVFPALGWSKAIAM